jgi:hypothetical protein
MSKDQKYRPAFNLPLEVRVHVQMTDEMYTALREENASTGCPLTEIVRRAVQAHLDERTPAPAPARESSPAPVLIATEPR